MINFSNWFQFGAMPQNIIPGSYNPVLVGLSYIVAVLASYVALNLVGRLRAETNRYAKIYWLIGGAFAMGAGIWSMHFIGMLAFIMPMPMDYDLGWTVASLLMAIVASAFALFILQKQHYSIAQLGLGGFIIGLAISTMHYMGMEGMKSHVDIHYLPGLFFLSVFIGIAAAEAAIYLALQSNQGSSRRQATLKVVSALVMGIAICGMHYTGMASAVFTENPAHMMVTANQIPPNYLAFFVAGITVLIIGLALTASSSYKKRIVAVQNEKDFLNTMLDNLVDGIIACDEQGNMTVLNYTLQKNINAKAKIPLNELLNILTFSTKDNKRLPNSEFPLCLALHGKAVQGVELTMRFPNHAVRDVIIDSQQITNSYGKNLGAVAVIHDVTELKRTERLKNEFISVVSHELRTPLTSIRGSLGLLVSGVMGKFQPKANKLLEIANSNCERLLLLINDILDIEKIEAGKMDFHLKKQDLNQIITESIASNAMYAEKFGVGLDLEKPNSKCLVLVDKSRLLQVLSNLLSNACKFSPPGEKITVTIKKMGEKVRVSVTDNGVGIAEEFQSRIFQKFSQADSSSTRGKGGTGLGLHISKTIVEKMGGILDFSSKPKAGTTFYFDLPLAHGKTAGEKVLAEKETRHTRRLLICEDDQAQSEYLKLLLESAGFVVDVAEDVKSAKVLLKAHDYEALLLDLILPDQDGIAFIRELRASETTKDLHIIVLSIMAQVGKTLLNGDAISIVDWFDKPVDFNKLLTAINRIKKHNGNPIPQILHIEDNRDVQHIVNSVLEGHATVFTADDLGQAKQMLKKNDYDLIILDLLLPDGNGAEILPMLAQQHLPVLVFSDIKLDEDYAKYVSQALIKSNSSNDTLLNTIMHLL